MEWNEDHTFTFIEIVKLEKVINVEPKIKSLESESDFQIAQCKKKIVYESVNEFLVNDINKFIIVQDLLNSTPIRFENWLVFSLSVMEIVELRVLKATFCIF